MIFTAWFPLLFGWVCCVARSKLAYQLRSFLCVWFSLVFVQDGEELEAFVAANSDVVTMAPGGQEVSVTTTLAVYFSLKRKNTANVNV